MSESTPRRPLLIGFDGRPQAQDALALGVLLATATGAPLVVAWMYGPEPVLFGMDPRPGAREDALRELDEVHDRVRRQGVEVEVRAITAGSPSQGLYRLIDELHPAAIVVGSCHRSPVGLLLAGSTASRLLQGASCPVLIAPKGYAFHAPDDLQGISIGFDGKPESWAALQHGAVLAAQAGAYLRLVSAVGPFVGASGDPVLSETLLEKRTRHAEVELERGRVSVSRRLQPVSHVIAMDPRWALEAEGEREDVDLVVVGSRGYGPLHRVFAGSVSMALVRSATVPVMVVPRSTEFDPSAGGMAAADELAV